MKPIKNEYPSDVAVCFSPNGESLTAATFAEDGSIETYEFYGIEANLHPALDSWRKQYGHRTDLQTIFRIVPFLFTEQTHVAALPEEVLSLDDKELTMWLIDSAITQASGTNGVPIFETALDKSLYDYARLPDGRISLTELPNERLNEALKRLVQASPLDEVEVARLTNYVPDDSQPFLLHAVETRLRVITRFLAKSESEYFRSLAPDETVAVFAFTTEGCGFALWNPSTSFFAEFGEWFNLNFDVNEIPEDMNQADYIAQLYVDSVHNFLHEQFYRHIEPEDINLPRINVQKIFWVASESLNQPLEPVWKEFSEQTNIATDYVGYLSMEEMIVRGMLLVHDEEAEAFVPSINLANDISRQNDSINAEEINLKVVADQKKRQVALACVALPLILVLGLVFGLWLNNKRISASLSRREAVAEKEQNRLKPILQTRADYEKTLKWFVDVLGQIVSLRQKQTSSLSFAARLDPLYPQTDAFYISDMKLAPGGAFELKGYTRDQLEVSAFVQSLEFAQDERQARYFTGLQLEFKQGSTITSSSTAPTVSGGGSSSLSANLAPGVSGFILKGSFAPASVLKPQQPAQNAPVAVQPANPNPAANNSQPNAAPNVQNANTGANKQ